jgi:hypothetical protein
MFARIFPVLTFLLLLAASTCAVPSVPSGLSAEFRPEGIFISWEHGGGQDVSFRVYRSLIGEQPSVLAVTKEKSFLDSTIVAGKEYQYALTAFDEIGESSEVGFTITNPGLEEKPFTISLVEPKDKVFSFGEEVEFVVMVESQKFEELQNLRAILVNQRSGSAKAFSFDSARKEFTLVEKLPEAEPGSEEGFSVNYSIQVSAGFEGSEFSESEIYVLTMVPVKELDLWQLSINLLAVFAPVFFVLILVFTLAFIGWLWWVKRKARREILKLELLELEKERHLWRHEAFKRKITPEQFREKEATLQSKRAAIEQKLGRRKGKVPKPRNTFQGYSLAEVREIMRLVKTIRRPAKGQTEDLLRAKLVGIGKTERVAKKAAQLVFRK